MNFKSAYILTLAVLMFSACKKDDHSTTNNSTVINAIQKGTWRITQYNDSGTDELYHFTGYNFTFASGTARAVKGSTTVTGTYHSHVDSNKRKFELNFGNNAPFDELNDDWEVIENTDTKIRLQDVSGGGSGTDLVTFERN